MISRRAVVAHIAALYMRRIGSIVWENCSFISAICSMSSSTMPRTSIRLFSCAASIILSSSVSSTFTEAEYCSCSMLSSCTTVCFCLILSFIIACFCIIIKKPVSKLFSPSLPHILFTQQILGVTIPYYEYQYNRYRRKRHKVCMKYL